MCLLGKENIAKRTLLIKLFYLQFITFKFTTIGNCTLFHTSLLDPQTSPEVIVWECFEQNRRYYQHTWCNELKVFLVVFFNFTRKILFASLSVPYQAWYRQVRKPTIKRTMWHYVSLLHTSAHICSTEGAVFLSLPCDVELRYVHGKYFGMCTFSGHEPFL